MPQAYLRMFPGVSRFPEIMPGITPCYIFSVCGVPPMWCNWFSSVRIVVTTHGLSLFKQKQSCRPLHLSALRSIRVSSFCNLPSAVVLQGVPVLWRFTQTQALLSSAIFNAFTLAQISLSCNLPSAVALQGVPAIGRLHSTGMSVSCHVSI